MEGLLKTEGYVSEEEYFRLDEASEERLEWVDGRVFPKNNPLGLLPEAMAGASDQHVDIASSLFIALGSQLRGKNCFVVNQDQKVKAGVGYLYPDLTVFCGERQKDERGNLTNPVVIIEVLSPATEDFDRSAKFEKLRELPSLQDYLLVSQNRVLVEHRHRRNEMHWELIYYNHADDEIALECIGCRVPIAEIYERVRPAS